MTWTKQDYFFFRCHKNSSQQINFLYDAIYEKKEPVQNVKDIK